MDNEGARRNACCAKSDFRLPFEFGFDRLRNCAGRGFARCYSGFFANAGPGSIIPSDADAVRFFKGACISGRTFERAPTYLATQPVVRNSRTGTYYHQRFDMSVKINKDRCSIVSAAPREGTKIDLRSATFVNADPNGSVVIGPLVQNSGRSYVSASVPSR